MTEDIRNFTIKELEQRFSRQGIEPYRARQVFAWLYRRGAEDFSVMSNLPAGLREKLGVLFSLEKVACEKIDTSSDLAQKFLVKFKDGCCVESVSIPHKSRLTACLSTQVGCRYACAFCASGALGFRRNLASSEIVAQYLILRKHVPMERVTNIVFMGVGEPLDNYESLLRAIRILNSPLGVNCGIRRMTVSTVGLPDGILRLAREGLELELSISLHAATDKKRSAIMPVNRQFPIQGVIDAVKAYIDATHRKVTFEYVLLGGFNTAAEDAQGLARLLRGLHAKVNLIPYNPGVLASKFQPPVKLEVLCFKSCLLKHGIEATVRMPRGADIAAACGQLRYQAARKSSG